MFVYPILLILTIVVEGFITLILVRCLALQTSASKVLFSSVFLNLFTHPLATISVAEFHVDLMLVETCEFIVEAICLRLLLEMRFSSALLIAFVANATTYSIGLMSSV